jgi:hypothetical protein
VAVLAFIFFPKLSFFIKNNPADSLSDTIGATHSGRGDSSSSHGTAIEPWPLSHGGSKPLYHDGSEPSSHGRSEPSSYGSLSFPGSIQSKWIDELEKEKEQARRNGLLEEEKRRLESDLLKERNHRQEAESKVMEEKNQRLEAEKRADSHLNHTLKVCT